MDGGQRIKRTIHFLYPLSIRYSPFRFGTLSLRRRSAVGLEVIDMLTVKASNETIQQSRTNATNTFQCDCMFCRGHPLQGHQDQGQS